MTDEQRDPAAGLKTQMLAFTEAFGRAAQAWLEQNRPFFEAVERLAADPRVRACIEAYERGEITVPRPCHCLCGRLHPADKGVCDGNAVTTRRFETDRTGPVDVALCAPCAVTQGVAVPVTAEPA